MVLLTDVLFGLLLVLFSYWMVVARPDDRCLLSPLAGVLAVALVPPRPLRLKRALSEQFNPC